MISQEKLRTDRAVQTLKE